MDELIKHLRAGGLITAPYEQDPYIVTVSSSAGGYYAMGDYHSWPTPEAAIDAACRRWNVAPEQFSPVNEG